MAKGIYIGDSNGTAKKVKSIYIGDSNGIAKKVKKIYIGDNNGIARLSYEDGVEVKIVPFASGTDAEIKAMLDAYYANELTWEDMGWAVGDTRTIHLNAMTAPNPNGENTWAAQDITVVIVAHDHTDLETPINKYTKGCITVQCREVLNNNSVGYNTNGHIYINGDSSKDTIFTKWANLYMRTYINDIVWDAFPNGDFKSSIKASKHNRHTTYKSSTSE